MHRVYSGMAEPNGALQSSAMKKKTGLAVIVPWMKPAANDIWSKSKSAAKT